MPESTHVLSFATDEKGQLFIHANAEGLDHLISSLARLRNNLDKNECDHDHLMTPSWGSDELSERTISETDKPNNLIHHVKIYSWTDEWTQKHGLSA